jgi:tetratricopeptide (TPR) repeat protein
MTLPDLTTLGVLDERLREVAADPAAAERAAAAAESELAEARAEGDLAAARRLLDYLGSVRRLLGQHEEAVRAHQEALELARAAGDRRTVTATLIRLGEACRCADDGAEAEAVLREALVLAPPELQDFALQHMGKTLLDQGRADEAVHCLEEALSLRRAAGEPALVASTERALAAAREAAS